MREVHGGSLPSPFELAANAPKRKRQNFLALVRQVETGDDEQHCASGVAIDPDPRWLAPGGMNGPRRRRLRRNRRNEFACGLVGLRRFASKLGLGPDRALDAAEGIAPWGRLGSSDKGVHSQRMAKANGLLALANTTDEGGEAHKIAASVAGGEVGPLSRVQVDLETPQPPVGALGVPGHPFRPVAPPIR